MTYVPHFPMTLVMPPNEDEIFANEAASTAVGQKFKFVDVDVVVLTACVHHGELYLTLDKVEETT